MNQNSKNIVKKYIHLYKKKYDETRMKIEKRKHFFDPTCEVNSTNSLKFIGIGRLLHLI